MVYLFLIIITLIFGNQYLLFNEEFFIILAFLSLCMLITNNLSNVVVNELQDRKVKVSSTYLDIVTKKGAKSTLSKKDMQKNGEFTQNFSRIEDIYYNDFEENYNDLFHDLDSEEEKKSDLDFIFYLARTVSNKRNII